MDVAVDFPGKSTRKYQCYGGRHSRREPSLHVQLSYKLGIECLVFMLINYPRGMSDIAFLFNKNFERRRDTAITSSDWFAAI